MASACSIWALQLQPSYSGNAITKLDGLGGGAISKNGDGGDVRCLQRFFSPLWLHDTESTINPLRTQVKMAKIQKRGQKGA